MPPSTPSLFTRRRVNKLPRTRNCLRNYGILIEICSLASARLLKNLILLFARDLLCTSCDLLYISRRELLALIQSQQLLSQRHFAAMRKSRALEPRQFAAAIFCNSGLCNSGGPDMRGWTRCRGRP